MTGNARCGSQNKFGPAERIECEGQLGRYVFVTRNTPFLSLCEVKVHELVTTLGTPIEYVGCVKNEAKEYGNGRRKKMDLPFAEGKGQEWQPGQVYGSGYTIERCAEMCDAKYFKYFGMMGKRQCWCGNSYGSQGPASKCDCNGNNIGGDKMCVYSLGYALPVVSAHPDPDATPPTTNLLLGLRDAQVSQSSSVHGGGGLSKLAVDGDWTQDYNEGTCS
jgi:hypothetical protein